MPDGTDQRRHLLHVFSTFGVGGPQTRFVSLANAMGRKYRHTVLAMDGNHGAGEGLDASLDFAFASMPVVKSAGISLANLRSARRLMRALKPDLLLTYNWGSIEWSLANRLFPLAPEIHLEDGFGPDEAPDRQAWRRVLFRHLSLARCARIVVPSRTLYDVAIKQWRLKAARVMHVPNGIDCDRFAREPDTGLLATLGIGGAVPVIGTVAALRREKNLGRLVHLFAALPPELGARLVIVGGGPELGAIRDSATALGVAERLVLAGAMAAPERLLGRFDVFALTSDTEQMPNSILEAMAAGLAILATDVGDLKRIVAPENAPFVLPREDERALGQALLALLRDRDLRGRIGRANRAHVRATYSLAAMVACYDALFTETCECDPHSFRSS
jgi:L-malate glycosyltransferase